MSADPSFPPPQTPPAIRPHIACRFDVSLDYLGAKGVAIESVVDGAKVAIANAVNDAAANSVINLAALIALVSDLPGIVRVRYLHANGDTVDLPATALAYLIDSPNEIDLGDVRIVPQ